MSVARQIKEEHCKVCEIKTEILNADETEFELPDRSVLRLKEMKIKVTEGLFNPEIARKDNPVPLAVHLNLQS